LGFARSVDAIVILVARAAWILLGAAAALCPALGACSKTTTSVTKPVTADLRAYRSCVVRLDAKDLGPEGDAFLEYLEGQLRTEGGLEPLDPFHENEADLVLSLSAEVVSEKAREATVKIGVTVAEKRSQDVLGAIEVRGTGTPDAPATTEEAAIRDTGGSARRMALHSAADEIVDYLRERRGEPRRPKRPVETHAPMIAKAPPDDPLPKDAPLPPPRTDLVCATACTPTASALSDSDVAKIAARTEPTMEILRKCLDRVEARRIEPAVILRFSPDGVLAQMRVDLGGYEDLVCVDEARSHPPRVFVRREAFVRCVLHCS
jgi:hypothetical protein